MPPIATTAPIDLLHIGTWLLEPLQQALQPRFRVLSLRGEVDASELMRRHCTSIRGLITHSTGLPATRSLIESLPKLEIIINIGSGSESIDTEAAHERGIRTFNGAGANAADVAELAMGLLLAAGRGLAIGDRLVRAGSWPRDLTPRYRRVSGRRLGILGLGEVGRRVARAAAGLDMEIAYFGRRPASGVPWRYESKLLEIARWSDFLLVALPGGMATHHLVDADVLQALGPQGFLISVGRGSVIDESALVRCIEEGCIAGAGLDVFENEPHVPPALIANDNVVLQPHRGGSTIDAFQAVLDRAVGNLQAHFSAAAGQSG